MYEKHLKNNTQGFKCAAVEPQENVAVKILDLM